MDNKTRRTLQLLELKILLEFKRICEKYNLKYFLCDGSLLGAVRYHGFVPWDDDVDVGMKRSEFNKFLKIAETELGSEFFLQTDKTESKYAFVHAKIRLIGTEYREPINEEILIQRGIWIDIFPFDNIPNSKIRREINKIILLLISSLYCHNVGNSYPKSTSLVKKIAHILFTDFAKTLPRKSLRNLLEKLLQKPNKNDSELIWNFPLNPHKSKNIEPFSTLPFEGFQFPVPGRYHDYLIERFGNYMQIPPENERKYHSPYEPYFGIYEYIKTKDDLFR